MTENEYTNAYLTEEERQAFIQGYLKALGHYKTRLELFISSELKNCFSNPFKCKKILQKLKDFDLDRIYSLQENEMYDYGFKDLFHDISEDL